MTFVTGAASLRELRHPSRAGRNILLGCAVQERRPTRRRVTGEPPYELNPQPRQSCRTLVPASHRDRALAPRLYPDKLFVSGNAAETVNNIAAHQWLFRVGMVSELVGAVILVYLTLAFYRLFAGVDRNLAVQVVIFGGVMPAVLYFVNVVTDAGALMIVRGADFLSVFDKPQRDALVMLLLTPAWPSIHCHPGVGRFVAFPVGDPGVQVAFCAALFGRVAFHRGLRLVDSVAYCVTGAAISGQGIRRLPTCVARRTGVHAVACHQRRQSGTDGHCCLTACGPGW